MNQVAEETHIVPASYAELAERLSRGGPRWLDELRHRAMEHFSDHGFPTPAEESWKYTNLSPLTQLNLDRRPFDPAREQVRLRETLFGAEKTAAELVFIDGHLEKGLSSFSQLVTSRAIVVSLKDAVQAGSPEVQESLSRQLEDPLISLNTALHEDGAFISVPAGFTVAAPIHLVFVSSGSGVTNARVVVRAGAGSELTVIETFVGPAAGSYFTNAVTTIDAADGSVVDHYRLQREGSEAFHISNLRSRQSRSSSVTSRVVSLGARLSRQQIETSLEGEGANVALDGLFILSGTQHADHNTVIDHRRPHSSSQEFYKGILDGESRGIFDGKIIVRKDAQKTSSKQVNKNLLLSPKAIVDSKPQLEINADDVKCNHGSTIGQIDENALFYMQARGLGRDEAKNLLVHGFASELVERMKVEPVRELLERYLLEHLGSGVRDQS